MEYEEAEPNPEHLIRSIAEQGYSLESSIADLIDNSISAKARGIEIEGGGHVLDLDQEAGVAAGGVVKTILVTS